MTVYSLARTGEFRFRATLTYLVTQKLTNIHQGIFNLSLENPIISYKLASRWDTLVHNYLLYSFTRSVITPAIYIDKTGREETIFTIRCGNSTYFLTLDWV